MNGDIPVEEFLAEAEEIIDSLNADLLTVTGAVSAGEKPDPSLINNVFRGAHSLKGISGLFGYTDLSGLSHTMENMLDRLRLGKIELNEDVLDLLFESVEMLRRIVAGKGQDEPPPLSEIEAITARLGEPEAAETKEQTEEEAAACVGLDILAVLTEYEEHRLHENIRDGMNIVKIRAAFELATFDEDLTELQAVAKQHGEIITTLPSAEESADDKITFDLIVGTEEPVSTFEEALAGRPVSFRLLREGQSSPAAKKPPAGKRAGKRKAKEPESKKAGKKQKDKAEEQEPREAPAETGREPSSLRTISQTVRVDISKLDNLMNTVGELVIAKNGMAQIIERLRNELGFNERVLELIKNIRTMERKLADLQSGVLEVRMVPVGQIFDKMHRNVRKLSRELSKDVEFKAEGGDTELDKLIIEELADPLMHIIRNSMDHGIEDAESRAALGKKEKGLIKLKAFQRGNHVVIEIYDDGCGLDLEAIRNKAVERGMLDKDDQPRDEELIEFLFAPGFSTAEEVSELSGRGVGLDVVKANIGALSGAIDVESTPGEGTRFSITLPITLAIIQALIVEAGAETFAIPLNSVQQGLMIPTSEIQTIEGREVIELRGKTLPLLRLDRLFNLGTRKDAGNGGNGRPPVGLDAESMLLNARFGSGPEIGGGIESDQDNVYVVKVGIAERGLGIIVDKLWGRQDIVIKSVGEILRGIKGIAGATELGNQRTVLVLDVMDLMEEAAVSMFSVNR